MREFLQAIAENPGDMTTREIFGDWLEEHGYFRGEAFCPIVLRPFDAWSFGIGIGSGSGYGSGDGIGYGIGYGYGSGYGSGSGRGIGIGSGYGSGYGIGYGSGIGSGSGSGIGIGSGLKREVFMKVGHAYLLHAGDWHTFVFRVVAQSGPFTYYVEKLSKISETNNGDNWHLLAKGDTKARKAATYLHYEDDPEDPHEVPLTIAAFHWEGKVPQEW